MQSSKLPLVIKDSTITGEMDFDFFYQMIKIKLTLTVKNILYLFDFIVTPDQVYIKTILPIDGIENTEYAKKWNQKKYLFNGNIINPIGFKTIEILTTQSILLIDKYKNDSEKWEENLTDIKYSNDNCLNISIKVLKEIKNV